jgi:uncharacterized membrane protein YhaH (DUF805 family)
MKARLSDLWDPRGTVDRGTYAFWGVCLAILKYNVDRILVAVTSEKRLSPLTYWMPGDLFGVFPLSGERAQSALLLVLVALPFVWTGVALTLRRTRDAGMPGGGVLLFFVPVVNLCFFAILCVLPSKLGEAGTGRSRGRTLDRWIPEGTLGSAAFSLLLVLPITAGLAWLSTQALKEYGWGLFVGLPFFLGLASAVIHGYRHPRSFWSCVAVAAVATVLLAGLLVGLAFEGVICILMATPIAFVLALLGATIGYLIQRRRAGGRDAATVVPSLALLLPGVFGLEHLSAREPPMREIRSEVLVDAPPECVWRHVVAFAELPPPTEFLFRAGVAYPLRAEIDGTGPGAVRHCVFSTGPFIEPIEVWDEPRWLEFTVSAQPPSMRELSPYPEITPPHLEHFLESHRGRFLLEPVDDGRTRLVGTTWYTNRMWPSAYWGVLSDEIIHRIHMRVLEHIRRRSEKSRG